MRKSISSFAIIKFKANETSRYLMQYNEKWGSFNFISGHFEPEKDENCHENTIQREIEEELPGLERHKDFYVQSLSNRVLRTVHFSKSAQQPTHYEFHLFQLFFLKPFAKYSYLWEKTGNNRWFTLDEILSGVSRDGDTISPFPARQINQFLPSGLEGLAESDS